MLAVIATSFACAMTSCEPDDVDSFAKGYRYGYTGRWAKGKNTVENTDSISVDADYNTSADYNE